MADKLNINLSWHKKGGKKKHKGGLQGKGTTERYSSLKFHANAIQTDTEGMLKGLKLFCESVRGISEHLLDLYSDHPRYSDLAVHFKRLAVSVEQDAVRSMEYQIRDHCLNPLSEFVAEYKSVKATIKERDAVAKECEHYQGKVQALHKTDPKYMLNQNKLGKARQRYQQNETEFNEAVESLEARATGLATPLTCLMASVVNCVSSMASSAKQTQETLSHTSPNQLSPACGYNYHRAGVKGDFARVSKPAEGKPEAHDSLVIPAFPEIHEVFAPAGEVEGVSHGFVNAKRFEWRSGPSGRISAFSENAHLDLLVDDEDEEDEDSDEEEEDDGDGANGQGEGDKGGGQSESGAGISEEPPSNASAISDSNGEANEMAHPRLGDLSIVPARDPPPVPPRKGASLFPVSSLQRPDVSSQRAASLAVGPGGHVAPPALPTRLARRGKAIEELLRKFEEPGDSPER